MIIDSLTHITENGKWFDTSLDASLGRLLREMDEAEVDKVLVAGLPFENNNDFVLKISKENPARFIPVMAVDPYKFKSLEELKKLKDAGAEGIKLHPRFSLFHPNSDKVSKVLDAATQIELPVLLCTIFRPPAPVLGRPIWDSIHELCAKHSDTKLILLHGGYWDILAVSEVIRPFENVYMDLSTTMMRFRETSLINDMKFILKTFDKRTIVGSDFPEYRPVDMLRTFKVVSELPIEKRDNILWKNLDNIFKK